MTKLNSQKMISNIFLISMGFWGFGVLSTSVVSSQHSYISFSETSSSSFGLLAAAGAAAALTAASSNDKSTAKCCGIAGVVGAKGDARDYLIEGLTILKNRGYDSAGIATMDDANPELVSWSECCLICSFLNISSTSIHLYFPAHL